MPSLFRPIKLRLPNDDQERHATWLEIFFDLIFALILVQLSERILHDLTYKGILLSILLFIPVVWTWASYTVFAARFDNNDSIHWLLTFVIMFAGIIMSIQIPKALESGTFGYAIGFIIGQASIMLLYLKARAQHTKAITSFYLIGFGSALMCWVISLFFSTSLEYIFWTIGMCIYLIIPWIGRKTILEQAPLDPIYIPERFGAFTIIILGQLIASVVFGLEYAQWNYSSIIAGILAFILVIIIFCQYYLFTKIANYKCTLRSGQPYIYAHIPLIISLVILGVCTEDFIKHFSLLHDRMNLIFCFAALLYLCSFSLLQHLAMSTIRIHHKYLALMLIAAIFICFLPFSHAVFMLGGIVLIFGGLLIAQLYISERQQR